MSDITQCIAFIADNYIIPSRGVRNLHIPVRRESAVLLIGPQELPPVRRLVTYRTNVAAVTLAEAMKHYGFERTSECLSSDGLHFKLYNNDELRRRSVCCGVRLASGSSTPLTLTSNEAATASKPSYIQH